VSFNRCASFVSTSYELKRIIDFSFAFFAMLLCFPVKGDKSEEKGDISVGHATKRSGGANFRKAAVFRYPYTPEKRTG